jgi:hypothetical protein
MAEIKEQEGIIVANVIVMAKQVTAEMNNGHAPIYVQYIVSLRKIIDAANNLKRERIMYAGKYADMAYHCENLVRGIKNLRTAKEINDTLYNIFERLVIYRRTDEQIREHLVEHYAMSVDHEQSKAA